MKSIISMTVRAVIVLAAGLMVFGLASCATPGSAPGASSAPAARAPSAQPVESPMYYGSGAGASQTEALNAAKIEAVRKAVNDALGVASAAANRDKVQAAVFAAGNVNPFVYNESMEILDRGGSDGSFSATIGIRINLEALANTLRAADIFGNIVLPQGGMVALPDQQKPSIAATQPAPEATAAAPAAEAPAPAPPPTPAEAAAALEVDPEEAAIIQSIVNNLSYMVYYDEDTAQDPFLTKVAIGMANRYLSQNGMNYVDMSQIERIKEDQAMIYEEETGRSVSILQWIAGKLNADIYIEVTVDSNSNTRDGRHYGSASVSLKNFDASTGAGRGTAFYQTVPPAMSTVSTQDAVNNAVASATFNAVRNAIEQAQVFTQRELVQGIRYDLIVQNTADARLMRDFQQRLERRVKSVRRVSTSPAETRYEVRMIGRVEDLEDLIYTVSDGLPGMEGMFMVLQRGNSITFNTGM